MLKRLRITVILFVLSISIHAQYESYLHKNIWDRNIGIDSLCHSFLNYDTMDFDREVATIKSLAIKKKDKALELSADYISLYYRILKRELNEGEIIEGLLNFIKKAEEENIVDIQANAVKMLADYYWITVKNYEFAFEYYLKTDQLLQQLNPETYPFWTEFYNKIAMAFYDFRDYERAIKYLSKARQMPVNEYNWKNVWSANNNLGLCYKKVQKVDSAMFYYNKALASPFVKEEGLRYTITKGNIGYTYYEDRDFDTALPLIEADYRNAVKFKDYGIAAGSLLPMADIYIEREEYEAVADLLSNARYFIVLSGQERRFLDYYEVFEKLYNKQGKYEMANKYKDSLYSITAKIHDKYDALILLRAQQKIDRQKLESEWDKSKLNKRLNTIRVVLYSLIFIMIIFLLILLQLYNRKKHLVSQQQKELEIQKAKDQLKRMTKNVAENKQIIKKLEKLNSAQDKTNIIAEIQKNSILTQEDWIDFKKNFQGIYPQFFDRIVKTDGVTPSELRLFCLTKLNLSSTEIATILGISPQSTRITWHRFKKKNNLPKDYSITDFIKDMS